jgi:hypothetical protein
MSVTSLAEIAYPVFKLGVDKPTISDGLVYYYYENIEEDDEGELIEQTQYRLVDDKNLPFNSLAMRRLAAKQNGAKLFKIKIAIFFLGDLIKIAKPNMWFIDSKGKLFNYEKRTRALLKFYKIRLNIPISTGGSILEVEGITTRFKILFSPDKDKKYAGILHLGKSLILYGVYNEQYDDTWRKV